MALFARRNPAAFLDTPAHSASDTPAMIFGRQNNLTRRAVRPDGRFTRDLRRRKAGRETTLLDIVSAPPARPSLLARFAAAVRRKLGRR